MPERVVDLGEARWCLRAAVIVVGKAIILQTPTAEANHRWQ
jgi:hypothetical protein